jgi:hypothetical protein
MREVKRDRRAKVLDFLAKSVRLRRASGYREPSPAAASFARLGALAPKVWPLKWK